MEAAHDFVLSYLPGSDPIWLGGATHGEHRFDAFQASADTTLHVLSRAVNGTLVPDVISSCPHIPL